MKTKILFFFIVCIIFTNLSACQTNTNMNHSNSEEIIFKDDLGNALTRKDIENSTGNVNYEVVRNKNIDNKAFVLHQEARELGQKGSYDLSISKLEEAINIQPNWAYPYYDLGYTFLLKGDFDNALKYYKKTDELEPKGFFTTKTAIYTLEGEQNGTFPKGMYITYMQIEWKNDVKEKLAIINKINEKYPSFAPAWKELVSFSDDKTVRIQAIEKGLSLEPDIETKGVLLINKAILLNEDGNTEEAKSILGNLIFSKESTTANVELAKFVLKSLID